MLAHSMLEGVRISSMHPTQFSSGDVIADRRADYARMLAENGEHEAAVELMEQALELVSQLLVAHFPRSPADRTDAADNLPDAPVVQGRFTKDV